MDYEIYEGLLKKVYDSRNIGDILSFLRKEVSSDITVTINNLEGNATIEQMDDIVLKMQDLCQDKIERGYGPEIPKEEREGEDLNQEESNLQYLGRALKACSSMLMRYAIQLGSEGHFEVYQNPKLKESLESGERVKIDNMVWIMIGEGRAPNAVEFKKYLGLLHTRPAGLPE